MMDLDRLAKCLRLLTSTHDGEVLAAAQRANAMLEAEGADWADLLRGGAPELSQEQMKRLYDEGYAAGVEQGRRSAREVGASMFVPASRSRSDELGQEYDRVARIVSAARNMRRMSDFEDEFVASMAARLRTYGRGAFVTEKQWGVLDRIEGKLQREGLL